MGLSAPYGSPIAIGARKHRRGAEAEDRQKPSSCRRISDSRSIASGNDRPNSDATRHAYSSGVGVFGSARSHSTN